MIYKLVFRIEAETDLEDIRDYYKKVSSTVTDNFFKELFLTLNFIEQEPKLFQERYRGIRIAPLYRYPYGIHYIEKKNQVIILRVLHTKRYFK
jgi:plasmid stabilization system protein ParE